VRFWCWCETRSGALGCWPGASRELAGSGSGAGADAEKRNHTSMAERPLRGREPHRKVSDPAERPTGPVGRDPADQAASAAGCYCGYRALGAGRGPTRSQSVGLPSSTLAGLTVGRRVEDRMRCAGLAASDSDEGGARRLTPPCATNLPLWRKVRPGCHELCRTEPCVLPDGSEGTGGSARQALAAGGCRSGKVTMPNWAERAPFAPLPPVRKVPRSNASSKCLLLKRTGR
jgi:hypothetical protein